MTKKKRLHFKDIDALRFFAFVPVFLFFVLYLSQTDEGGIHYQITNAVDLIKQNSLDFFFFLSAFLLTSQGLREYKYFVSFSLKKFLTRRVLRIFPLFAIVILFTFIIHPWIIKVLNLESIAVPSVSSYVFLVPNYFSGFAEEQHIYIPVLWTIYMFIQFYLIWGVVLKYFKNNLVTIGFIAVGIGIAARIVRYFMATDFEFDTLSYGVPIGIGTLVAVLVRNDSGYIEWIKSLPKGISMAIYGMGCLIVIGGYLVAGRSMFNSLIPVITCSFYAYVIIEQTFGKHSAFKLRNLVLFSHLGKISYGLIVYAAIISVLITTGISSLDFDISEPSVKIAFLLCNFVLTWIAADLSFSLYEKPLLRIRREFKLV